MPAENFGQTLHLLWGWAFNCWIEKMVMFWEKKPDPCQIWEQSETSCVEAAQTIGVGNKSS